MAESPCLTLPAQDRIFLQFRWISNHMQITTYKKLTKSLNSFQRYWQFVISENFGHTIQYPTKTTWQTQHYPWICNYTQQISKRTQPFPEILALCYLSIPGMPDHTQQIFMILLKLLWTSNYMQKMNIMPQIVFEILKFKKSCNLIGGEHFGL